MAAGRRRPRPAGRLARPAPPLDASSAPTGSAPTGWCPPTSPRELLVEERRLFYVACTRARERLVVTAVASPRGRRRPAVPVPRRARRDRRGGRGPARRAPCRWAGWSRELRRTVADPDVEPGPAAPPPRAGWRGWPARPPATGRWSPMADPSTWWGTRVGQPVGRSRCATPTSRCRSRPASSTRFDVCPTQWFLAREAGGVARSAPVRQPRRDRARARPAGRRRRARGPGPTGVDAADGARREGLGPAGVPDAVGQGARARADRGRRSAGSSPGTTPTPAPWSGIEERFRAVLDLPNGEQVPAGRLRRPARARRRRPGRGRRPQDRPHQAHRQVGAHQRPARPLPARRRPRGRRRARSRRRRPRPGGAELVQLGLHRRRPRRPPSSPSPTRPTTARSAAALRGRLARAAAAAAHRAASRRSPASTAATAPSSRSARSRARVTVIGPVTRRRRVRRSTPPADLAAAMGAAWEASEQQWAAITAPLAPAVVIAGAGSGKTTLMAARVVYLVLTGQVRPDQVLGLTFTTKAASELRGRIRAGADRRRRARTTPGPDGRGRPRADRRDLQRLRRRPAHRPRAADRPRARHPGDHRRGALPARRAGGRPAHRRDRPAQRPPRDGRSRTSSTSTADERAPRRARRRPPGRRARRWPRFRAAAEEERAGKNRTTYVERDRRRPPTRSSAAASCSAWSTATGG